MAFVGPMTMALALGALALFDDEDAQLPRRRWKRLSWPDHPLFYATIAIFAVTALPQLIVDSIQLQWTFNVGSRTVRLAGIVVMLPYIAGALAFFILASLVRYKAPLYLFIAAVLCGIATLAKGLAGLGLPVIIFLAYLAFTWNWRRLRRAQLLFGVAVALLACAVVADPLAPRDADPPRPSVLGRALRRQPLAPPGAGPPRRSRQLRVLPARARLRGAALAGDRAGERWPRR